MKYMVSVLAGIGLLALGGTYMWRTADATTGQPAATALLAEKVERLEAQSHAMRRKLAATERTLRLDHQTTAATAEQPQPQAEPKEPDEPKRALTKEERAARRALAEQREDAAIEHAKKGFYKHWAGEATDPSWTGVTNDALTALLQGEQFVGTRAESVECKQSLCRFEVSHDDQRAWTTFIHSLSGPLSGGSSFFNFDPETKRAVVYISRDGQPLPELEADEG